MKNRSDLMTTAEAAEYLRRSPRTLERGRVAGGGPKFLKPDGRVLYRPGDLDDWLEASVRRSTSDPGPR